MKKNSAIEETVLTLKKEIQEHNFNYYVKDDPTVTDSAYDDLMRKLEGLEKQRLDLQQSYDRFGRKTNADRPQGTKLNIEV
mgnify:CR=1 FL=1